MNKIERIIIQRTAITDEKLLSEIMNQLGEFPDTPSPCKALTRQICKETQLRGNGGTIILLLSRPNPHLSFVPNKSPEELEGPFTTTEPSWPNGTPIEVEFKDIKDYYQELGAEIIILIPIEPHEDLDTKVIATVAAALFDPEVMTMVEELFPEELTEDSS